MKEVRVLTGEVADGDGNAGDCDESEIVEGVEVADDFGEGRVTINDRVLWLRRCSDVCVHLSSFLLSRCYNTHALDFSTTTSTTTLAAACLVLSSYVRSFVGSNGPFLSSFPSQAHFRRIG